MPRIKKRIQHWSGETEYEKNQRFNFIVSWLHSLRYKNIIALFEDLRQKIGNRPIHVLDIGCAHAKLFSVLNEKFNIYYTGVEISEDFIKVANSRYGHLSNFTIIHDCVKNVLVNLQPVDIIVALETLEHIPEHDVVRIIESIAKIKPKLFICSVPVEIGPAIWLKNIGSTAVGYVRHKEYSWLETFWSGLYQLDKLPPHICHKAFDWRWLAQTIRHNLKILKIRKFPFNTLPAMVAFSVFIVAEPR